MPNTLDIAIVNYNSADFIGLNLFSFDKLLKNPYRLIICDNGSSAHDMNKLKKVCEDRDNVELIFRKQTVAGSAGHGEALNLLVGKMSSSLGVILDADCVFLEKHWDEVLIGQLGGECKIIGTQPPEPKPQDFPLMFGVLFDVASMKSLNIDFRPSDIATGKDTGWQMREKFLAAGLTGKILPMKNTRNFKDGPFKNINACAEYYLGNKIIASHFSRGSNPFAKNRSQKHIRIVSPLLNYLAWKIDKAKWIRTAKKIITDRTSHE